MAKDEVLDYVATLEEVIADMGERDPLDQAEETGHGPAPAAQPVAAEPAGAAVVDSDLDPPEGSQTQRASIRPSSMAAYSCRTEIRVGEPPTTVPTYGVSRLGAPARR